MSKSMTISQNSAQQCGIQNTGNSGYHIDALSNSTPVQFPHGERASLRYVVVSGRKLRVGKDDVVKLTSGFSQPNLMGGSVKGGYGGGFQCGVLDSIGGEASSRRNPSFIALVAGQSGARRSASTAVSIAADTTLKPGESYSTPRSFVAVYYGTFMSRCVCGRVFSKKKAGNSEAVE